MAVITLDKLSKVYPNGTTAVSELELSVADGEFLVLVGPSGCGKTTALRMVAGLEGITSGELRFDDHVVNDVLPRDRDVAMVFQNYALYPHMSVADNIGFALTQRRVPKEEARRRIREAAYILGLTEVLSRKPGQLSGGQRQRVAMGRAIVREPAVFLMDEPLSNLDAKLRVQMRAEVSNIQRRVGVATMYVTHDQTEAMTMGDRVAVLRDGLLQQCDTPQALYDRPANLFVAAFIGSPAMNLYKGQLVAASDGAPMVVLEDQRLTFSPGLLESRSALGRYAGRPVVIGIRPEHLHLSGAVERSQRATPSADAHADGVEPRVEAKVGLVEGLGSELVVHFELAAKRVHVDIPTDDDAEDESLPPVAQAYSTARVPPRTPVAVGDRVSLFIEEDEVHFFDPATGGAIVA